MLLKVADRLCDELGYVETGDVPGEHSPLSEALMVSGTLGVEDEELVASLRRALAKIAAALSATTEHRREHAVLAALGGVESVIRGELVSGNAEQLPELMPSFVFLVALPIVEQDRALELSTRTSQLIA